MVDFVGMELLNNESYSYLVKALGEGQDFSFEVGLARG